MDDLIGRSWLLSEYDKRHKGPPGGARKLIEEAPSAEPKIIYCKDCKHFIREDIEEYTPYGFDNTYFHAFCDKHWDEEQGEYIDVNLDDYCSFAERRKDG